MSLNAVGDSAGAAEIVSIIEDQDERHQLVRYLRE